MVFERIQQLINYGIKTGLLDSREEIYARNLLLAKLDLAEFIEPEEVKDAPLEEILDGLCDFAAKQGLLENNSVVYRDLFDAALMNALMPRPGQVADIFWSLYEQSRMAATDYYYKLSQDSNYIRRYRIAKDKKWTVETKYGTMDITINLSKPEKDPKAIAAAAKAKKSGYPPCLLCKENEGYAGHASHPARQNHRVIPLTINGEDWGFQYSPYVYYNEHCIVFSGEHRPMKIDEAAFRKLFDFVEQFPHYFLGSNADLPIVGGSILSHDHFQGGNFEFAMARAKEEKTYTIPGYEEVEVGMVYWPLSVLRLRSGDRETVIKLATYILDKWRAYTDEEADIFAETDGEPHNTITPIARMRGDAFELDLTLRNNLTTKEHPLGLYHPHEKLHHIKKENIGLIEVMGLAVLPARLKGELEALRAAILSGADLRQDAELSKHADWVEEFLPAYDSVTEENLEGILEKEVGLVFEQVLEDAGVYKCTPEGREAFERFIHSL